MTNPADFRPLPAHPNVYDRASHRPDWTRLLFPEGKLAQSTAVGDALALEERARKSIGDMVASDGDRIEGPAPIVDTDLGTVTLGEHLIYALGRTRSIAGATFSTIPMTGEVTIGVRVTSQLVTHVEDDALLGLHEGTASYQEDGPIAEVQSIAWGWVVDETTNDGGTGELVPVYRLIDGVIIDQTRPADLSVVAQRMELYDYHSNGNYIVEGSEVFALGAVTITDPDTLETFDAQAFSIAAGVVNVLGVKRTRSSDMRLEVIEDPALGTVDLEPHSFEDGSTGTATIDLRRTPVQTVSTAIVTKQITETVIRSAGATDTLGQDGVQQILTVQQGATPYAVDTDYVQNGDTVDWSPAGSAPATGESYDVTYLFLDQVPIDSATSTSVTVSGGVTGEPVFIAYTYKLPRIDRVCIDREGLPVYLKGVAAPQNPLPPTIPDTVLSLATVTNDWFGVPQVRSDGTRRITEAEQHRFNQAIIGVLDLIGLERLRREINSLEPTAKEGVFVDDFTGDRWRDSGETQTGAVFDGGLELPIEATITGIDLIGPVLLDFTHEEVIIQDLATACMNINPYQSFAPPPARMELTPASDFWEENNTIWDNVTRTFGRGSRTSRSTTTETLGTTTTEARFLRQILVSFRIEGFGGGENLSILTFDGLDVTPSGLTANAQGVLTASFEIPPNVSVGTKAVVAVGEGGSTGITEFVGGGVINTTQMRRITTIRRSPAPRPRVRQTPTGSGSNNRESQESERTHWDNDTRRAETSPPGYRGTMDPLAQTFMLLDDRMITGIDVQICAVGDRSNPVICEITEVQNGIPTGNVIAQTEVDMQQVVLNQWTAFDFAIPIFVSAGVEYAFVFKTDDADHSLRIASRGDFDATLQQFVGAQPYIVGVLLSSSNARTWTPHQDSDLTMRVRAAIFDPTQLEVILGTVDVTNMSDVLVQAAVDLPTGAAWLVFDLHFDDTSVVTVEPNQPARLDAYYTGSVEIRARLIGAAWISPILYPRVLFVAGELQAEGTYISRAFDMGENIRLWARMKAFLPTGSTLTVEYDQADDTWLPMPLTQAQPIEQGWQEQQFEDTPIAATQGRLRLTLSGNPAARPVVSDLRTARI